MEIMHNQNIDWNSLLYKDCKDMTEDEVKNIVGLSKSWNTCAVGVKHITSQKNSEGIPVDYELRHLGDRFHWALNSMFHYWTHKSNPLFMGKTNLTRANEFRFSAIEILAVIVKFNDRIVA